jgi:hypothetical protein
VRKAGKHEEVARAGSAYACSRRERTLRTRRGSVWIPGRQRRCFVFPATRTYLIIFVVLLDRNEITIYVSLVDGFPIMVLLVDIGVSLVSPNKTHQPCISFKRLVSYFIEISFCTINFILFTLQNATKFKLKGNKVKSTKVIEKNRISSTSQIFVYILFIYLLLCI